MKEANDDDANELVDPCPTRMQALDAELCGDCPSIEGPREPRPCQNVGVR